MLEVFASNYSIERKFDLIFYKINLLSNGENKNLILVGLKTLKVKYDNMKNGESIHFSEEKIKSLSAKDAAFFAEFSYRLKDNKKEMESDLNRFNVLIDNILEKNGISTFDINKAIVLRDALPN